MFAVDLKATRKLLLTIAGPTRPQQKDYGMTTKFMRTILAVGLSSLLQCSLFGQGQNIEIRFLEAQFTDTISGKDLVAVFLVSTKDTASFPPQIKIPPKCTVFEDGREKVVQLTPHNLSISLDDSRIAEKNPKTYALIKNLIDVKLLSPSSMIITYGIKDLNYNFRKMSMTPAFGEKSNHAINVDKRCEFEVK